VTPVGKIDARMKRWLISREHYGTSVDYKPCRKMSHEPLILNPEWDEDEMEHAYCMLRKGHKGLHVAFDEYGSKQGRVIARWVNSVKDIFGIEGGRW
jgi:hypothetical protein